MSQDEKWSPEHGAAGCDADPADAVSRRRLMKWSGTAGIIAFAATVGSACSPFPTDDRAADANGVVLPEGFTSRIIARAGERVGRSGLEFRAFPDGAATFVDQEVPGGWYLTVNHEIPGVGGVSSIRFAPDGTIVDAFSVCADTGLNCAGGATPWGTWLTCEEFDWGHVWECDPTGRMPARRRRAMGAFCHEAAAVAADGSIYMTEDRPDGGLYRFIPTEAGDLGRGLLEIATGDITEGQVTWVEVPHPDPSIGETLCRHQVASTMHFNGGEGIATDGTTVWFSTKGDNRVWAYDPATQHVAVRYQAGRPSILSGVDNLWFDAHSGNLFVAEDGDDMEIVMLNADNEVSAVVRLPDQDLSEMTGPCFSPDGTRLYFNSQRGPVGALGLPLGITYEITGPFDRLFASHGTGTA